MEKDGQEVRGPGVSVDATECSLSIVDDFETQRSAAGPITSQKSLLYDRYFAYSHSLTAWWKGGFGVC